MKVHRPFPHSDQVEVESQRTEAAPAAEVEAVGAADGGGGEGEGEGVIGPVTTALTCPPAALFETAENAGAPTAVTCTNGALVTVGSLRG